MAVRAQELWVKLYWLLGLGLLILLAFGAISTGAAGPTTRSYLPMLYKDSTSTPTVTPTITPTNTPTVTLTPIPPVVRFQYRAYVQNQGWQDWRDENGDAGTTGQALNIQAFQMRLTSGGPNVRLRYRAHVANLGWMDYQTSSVGSEGGVAGTTNTGNQIEAMQVGFDNAPVGTTVSLEPYVADWAWIGRVRDFWIAGTTGQARRIEAFHAYTRLGSPQPASLGVAYNGRIETAADYAGWQRNGATLGTTGQSKRLELFRVVLFQRPENMDIEYRCNVQDSGWTTFLAAGVDCGQVGKAIYSVEMRLVNPYPGTVLSYSGHFANVGTLVYASDNPNSNPILANGGNNRLEAIGVGLGSQIAAQMQAAAGNRP